MSTLFTNPCFLLFLGGGLGANARYWIGEYFKHRHLTDTFPWHTLFINVLGAVGLGVLVAFMKTRTPLTLFLGVGLCGGFTTFSTFCLESWEMIEKDRWFSAIGYQLASLIAGVGGLALAIKLLK